MRKLFGTDGIRGVAGRSPLTPAEVLGLGRAAGKVLKEKFPTGRCRVLAVRDTRESSAPLLQTLSQGLRECGVDLFDAGVLSTPSGAFLVREHRFQSGVVISASHNPPEFNGIKFFTAAGRKWPDEWEKMVELRFASPAGRSSLQTNGKRARLGELVPSQNLAADYEDFLIETLGDDRDFSDLKIAMDCSNGANSRVAPEVFRRLGAKVILMGADPNGKNINVKCGSQHPERLGKLVKKNRCDVGVAFDGDGDRVMFVDEKGNATDGDYVIALLAKEMHKRKQLPNKTVVITVMANMGLKKAIQKLGLRAIETPVGDRHVSEAMRQHGAALGGEQSGHIILGEHLPTGDGLLTALHVLAVVNREKKPFSKLVGWMKKYPQILLNVPVKERKPLDSLDGVQEKIEGIEKILGSDGRVLVRFSGTEPLLRIMLEGQDSDEIEGFAKEIAKAVTTAGC